MNIEYNLTNLFAVPVFNTVINGITDYDKISLTNIEYERSDYNSCSISENKYILEDQKYSFIKSKILEKFEFYVREIGRAHV